ncbi:acetyl esterase [Providencia huaxiensis]|uniref:acetyl esterase n=1 Tax=Providencia huaxiensis TaxID=2027290 RepID=UPI001E4DFAFB|nr:acetyl esterase [Providencia huaxiensis]MCD2527419.1 acetyl esterase [Providencia huaxiensis]
MNPKNKINVLDHISPEMQSVMQFYAENPSPSPIDTSYYGMRQAYIEDRKYWNAEAPMMHNIYDIQVPTQYGNILTRLFQPIKSPSATLFYLHGGGFILGNLQTHERIMRLLALYSGSTVIGVDYSLSPEARYPQAIEEISTVYQYYQQNAAQHNINMQQTGFAGDSAGAMLSLASVLWLRDNIIENANIKSVLLWYGLYGLQDSISRQLYGGEWDGLQKEDLENYDNAYLGENGDRSAPYYCLFNNDLTYGIPPCFIASAEFDPLLDDSLALFRTLDTNNMPCEYKMYPGTLHAFLHYSRMMQISDEAIRDGANYFIKQLL